MENTNIIIIQGVHAYEQNGVAYISLEDAARGLGFTHIERSGNECVRWDRVRGYLQELGYAPTGGCDNKLPDFIPENIFYRLAMKAKNEVAEKFQALVADEIIPSIRKTGGYIAGQEKMTDDELVAAALLVAQRRIEERDKRIEDLTVEKNALVSGVLHWKDSSVLNAIIRRMASYAYFNDFSRAWTAFFKELYYKHSIGLEARKTAWCNANPMKRSKATYKYLNEDEIDVAIQTAVALCAETGLDVADILSNYQNGVVA